MSSEPIRSSENHRRLHPVFHFFILAVAAVNVIVAVVAVKAFSLLETWNAIMALALVGLAVIVRYYATKNQDRIIRVEETGRLWRVLPPELRPRIADLTGGQLIALRFCGDDELPSWFVQCWLGAAHPAPCPTSARPRQHHEAHPQPAV